MTISKNIKTLREKFNLTQDELGKIAGVSGKTVSARECGRGQPDADMLIKLCEIYKVDSISYFFGEKEKFYSAEEEKLVSLFSYLNSEGKERVLEYMEDLVFGGRFSKKNNPIGLGEKEA